MFCSALKSFGTCGRIIVLLTSLYLTGSIDSTSAAPPAGYYEVWGDEFNGAALDTTKWDYWLLGNRRDAVNVANAVSVAGGVLTLTTYTTNGTHYTAMVATDGTFRSRYGYWEASIKWGDTNGMWSAFWMQSPTMGTYLSDPFVSGSELDIVEHRSTDGGSNGNIINQVQNNIHWNGYGSSAASAGSGNVGIGLGSGFHTYGFLWTPSAYTLYVDGSNLRSWSYANNGVPVSESSEWAILSSEVDDTSTTWAGQIPPGGYGNLGTSTTKMMVDYVRYYVPTNTIFWSGASSIYLTNSANFVSNMPPLTTSDLTFSSLSGNNLSPLLGGNLTVDGLVFLNMNNAVTIGGTNTLTLGAGGLDMVAANHSVSINCPVNIGGAQTWAIGINNPGNTLTANGSISGAGALSKGGYGTVILNGANTFSGTLNVDTGSTSANDGKLQITRSQNILNVASPISIRNNNSGSSTLQLNATAGNIVVSQDISMAGRNTNVIAIQNLSGSNTLAGNFIFASGGANYWFDSDNGTLNLAGLVPASAPSVPSARTLTFMGNGNFLISGAISNANGYAVSVIKTNAGVLTMNGVNKYTGSTTIAGGTLAGTGTLAGPVTIAGAATLSPGGSAIGTMTINGALTNSGIISLRLNKSGGSLTNDNIVGLTTLALGGTLRLTIAGCQLTAGDSFRLFSAANYRGGFSNVTPAVPGYNLVWNTNNLTVNGSLGVSVGAVTPVISGIAFSGTNFLMSGSGGAAGYGFSVLSTTDLTQPLTNWTLQASGVCDSGGNFLVTNIFSGSSAAYYTIRIP